MLHTDINKPAPSLLQSICNPSSKSLDHVPAIKWGKEKEPVALQQYSAIMTDQHLDFKTICRSAVMSAIPVHWCFCRFCFKLFMLRKRVVEVKCPFAHKDSTVHDYVNDPSSCLRENGREIKQNHKPDSAANVCAWG